MHNGFLGSLAFAAAALSVAPPAVIAQQGQPVPTPSATPSATFSPSPMPSETMPPSALPSPTPTPTPSPTPTPVVTAAPLPTPLVLPPDAPPQILAVSVSDPVFHSGETVTGTVITSTNVSAVEIRLVGHSVRLPRANAGVFQMTYTMPHVPFFLKRTYTAQVVAMNGSGAEAERDLTVSIR